MSWLGDLERADPAYPGSPGDGDTAWTLGDAEQLNARIEAEEERERLAGEKRCSRIRKRGR